MTRTGEMILREALALNESDRATLAGLLIDSLEAVSEEGVEQAWAIEVERRAAQIDSSELAAIPWKEVRTRLLKNKRDASIG